MRRAGFVLVGGRSSRMGTDKALLPFGSRTLVEYIADQVRDAAGSVTLVGAVERYRHLPYPTLDDETPDSGPLGGILAAFDSSDADWLLIVACDMPNVSSAFLGKLLDAAESAEGIDCLIPETADGPQPLCAAYNRRALPRLREALAAGHLKMKRVIDDLVQRRWPVTDARPLVNVNTPEDWINEVEPPVAKPPAIERTAGAPGSIGEFPHYLEFRQVYKTFDHPVLVDVSFFADAGETLAIIGRSGVGKSVSLGHIMGFLKPDQGRVIVANTDVTDFSEAEWRKIRKKVTMVFQSGALFDSLTVGENILFSLELRADYNAANKEQIVDGLLGMVDLLDYKDAYPTDLSTGFKRAVAIARALAAQPECILYDEPTTMVDPIMSDHLGNLMLRLKRQLKLTSVVVTHDLDLMRKVADTVVFLFEGRAIFFGKTADLEKSDHPHIREFLAMDRVEIV